MNLSAGSDPPGDAKRVSSLLAQALLQPENERSSFLDRECKGNGALKSRVLSLLSALPAGEMLFDTAAMEETVAAAAIEAVVSQRDRVGQMVSHYRIEAFLGAGGMGEVYRVWDLALGRPAAMKFLLPGVDPDIRSRLLKEAKTSARFEHPAIAAFYEAGTVDGADFLAMEFVEGETLRSRLKRDGSLPVAEALSMAATILEALIHSHAAAVVHRDIKPENIMLSEGGRVRLLDFGIAKDVATPEVVSDSATRLFLDTKLTEEMASEMATTLILATKLTAHGMIVGTLGYMSPEQLCGDAVSESTDLFSLGAVLYESLTGHAAFPGKTVRERIAAVLGRDIDHLTIDGMTEDINAILARALARDPALRYRNAREFLADLRRYATGQVVAVLPNTLAIMDLENLSRLAEDDWMGSGIAESLSSDLSRVQDIILVPRQRIGQAQARLAAQGSGNTDPVALGLALGCRYVLAGGFQRMGDALRLTVRMVEVSTGSDVWAEKLDGGANELFTMQDRLAELTTASLHVALPEKGDARDADLDVFELQTRAEQLMRNMGSATATEAIALLERALAIDPNHAPSLSTMACYHSPGKWLMTGDQADLQAAELYSERAVAADPSHASGHLWLGYARWRQGKLPEALESLTRAEHMGGCLVPPGYFGGICFAEMGRLEEAIETHQRAIRAEPRMPMILQVLANDQMAVADLETAAWILEQSLEVEQSGPRLRWGGTGFQLAECLRRMGRLVEARRCAMESLKYLEGEDLVFRRQFRLGTMLTLGKIFVDEGDHDSARAAFLQALGVLESASIGPFARCLAIQAQAGLSQAGGGTEPFEQALDLLEQPVRLHWTVLMTREILLVELAKAARALGRSVETTHLMTLARAAGYRDGADPTQP